MRNMDAYFPPETQLSILFHGGEPLLAGYDFYKNAFALLRSFDRKIGLGVQTNLTLLDDRLIELFKENGCGFGTSLDGDAQVNCKTRLMKHGSETNFDLVTRGIGLLKDHGMDTGIISVITEHNLDAKRYYRFAKNVGVWSVTPNPMYEFDESRIGAPSLRAIGDFYVDLFDLWMADDDPPHIDFFERIIHTFLGAIPARKCVFTRDCTRCMMAVDTDGEVYLCTHWLGQSNYSYGNALTVPFSKIWESASRSRLSTRPDNLGTQCHDCRYWDQCYGGCMGHTREDFNDRDYFCPVYRRVFSHIEKTLRGALV